MSAGLLERQRECGGLHLLRCGGWRVLPDGEWVDPRTGALAATFERAARVQAERDAGERRRDAPGHTTGRTRRAAERAEAQRVRDAARVQPPPREPSPAERRAFEAMADAIDALVGAGKDGAA